MFIRTRPNVKFIRKLPVLYWLACSPAQFYLLTRLCGITCQNVVLSVSNIYKIVFTRVVGTKGKRIICTPEKLGSWYLGITHFPCSRRGYTCMRCITIILNNKIHLSEYKRLLRHVSVISYSHLQEALIYKYM